MAAYLQILIRLKVGLKPDYSWGEAQQTLREFEAF